VRGEEFELTTEVTRRRLRRLGMLGIADQLGQKFLGRQADLIQVTLLTELNALRHDVDAELIEQVIGNVSDGVGHDGDTPLLVVRRYLLALHVVSFLAGHFTEQAGDAKHLGWVVYVNMNFGLARRSCQYQRRAQLGQLFA
jgi:hypothetical protein